MVKKVLKENSFITYIMDKFNTKTFFIIEKISFYSMLLSSLKSKNYMNVRKVI